MAERRMFAKTIVLSDAFLDLPMSARCLYFTLGMLADDDGFVNAPRSIMRQCGASDDDMKNLLAKKFVLLFESGVIVIKHWRINNYLRSDRYTETKYADEKNELTIEENGAYRREELPPPEEEPKGKELRRKVYAESDLPNSFDYKIRHAFHGRPCPMCGFEMLDVEKGIHRPTIQHNTPISKGGKHELSNISVICHSCNMSNQAKPTGPLNNAEVVSEWAKIIGIPINGIPSGIPTGIPSIGKDSIDKFSLEEDRKGKGECEGENPPRDGFPQPPVEKSDASAILSAEKKRERIDWFVKRLQFHEDVNYPTDCWYSMAAREGITRSEIDLRKIQLDKQKEMQK